MKINILFIVFFKIYFYLCLYMCVCVSTYECRCPHRTEEFWSTGSIVIGGCEPSEMVNGNQTWVLCKTVGTFKL